MPRTHRTDYPDLEPEGQATVKTLAPAVTLKEDIGDLKKQRSRIQETTCFEVQLIEKMQDKTMPALKQFQPDA